MKCSWRYARLAPGWYVLNPSHSRLIDLEPDDALLNPLADGLGQSRVIRR